MLLSFAHALDENFSIIYCANDENKLLTGRKIIIRELKMPLNVDCIFRMDPSWLKTQSWWATKIIALGRRGTKQT